MGRVRKKGCLGCKVERLERQVQLLIALVAGLCIHELFEAVRAVLS
jgi:hypothetical protein